MAINRRLLPMEILNIGCTIDTELLGMEEAAIKSMSLEDLERVSGTITGDILVWNNNYIFTPAHLARLPKLKLLINWGTDTSNISCVEEIEHKNIKIVTTKGYATSTVSGFILDQLRAQPIDLRASRVGFLGFGRIGYATGKSLAQIGTKVQFTSRSTKYFGPLYESVSLPELLQNQILVIGVDTDECLLTEVLVKEVKQPITIINISRESVVSPVFIQKLIEQGKLSLYLSDNFTSHDIYNNGKCIFTGNRAYKSAISKESKLHKLKFFCQQHLIMRHKHIHMARHGETEWNREGRMQGQLDSSLTEKGKRQAAALAAYFSKAKIQTLLVSPMGRCQATAEIIRDIHPCHIETIEMMAEMNFGDFQGKLKSALKTHAFFEERKADKLHVPYPNGESYWDVFQRLEGPIQEAVGRHSEPIGIVGHESINRMIPPVLLDTISLEEAVQHRQANNEVVGINFETKTRTLNEI